MQIFKRKRPSPVLSAKESERHPGLVIRSHPYFPDGIMTEIPWFRKAHTFNAEIGLTEISPGVYILVWYKGTWIKGTWKEGIWQQGVWKSGKWKTGVWEDGIWESGTWYCGVWLSGYWESGTQWYIDWRGGHFRTKDDTLYWRQHH